MEGLTHWRFSTPPVSKRAIYPTILLDCRRAADDYTLQCYEPYYSTYQFIAYVSFWVFRWYALCVIWYCLLWWVDCFCLEEWEITLCRCVEPLHSVWYKDTAELCARANCIWRAKAKYYIYITWVMELWLEVSTVMTVDCHLEFSCPIVKNVLIVFLKVRQLNEIGETPTWHVLMWLTFVRPR